MLNPRGCCRVDPYHRQRPVRRSVAGRPRALLPEGDERMPRFYFDVYDTGRFSRDEEGLELSSIEEARSQALAALRDIARDELPDGDRREFLVKVRDGDSEPIMTASLVLHVERKV